MAKQKDEYIGQSFGEYKVKKLIGKGGMSRVYQGEDVNLGREVAIKIITLDPDRAKELMKRFEREGRTMGRLDRHPNIVRVYRYNNSEEPRYLVMEYIEGETLTQKLARYRNQGDYMPFDEIVRIMEQVADALDFAHTNGVIHRDIKPSNIMIEEGNGRAVLMDFGLVMQADTETTLGTAFGTPRYISPEQAISSQQAVPQSDIYSLGVIIYEMLTGKAPFEDESAMSLALSHITNPPPNPIDIREDLSEDIANVILKALEKTPEDRYQTARAMVDALAVAASVKVGTTGSVQPSTPPPSPPPPEPEPAPAPAKAKKKGKVDSERPAAPAPPPAKAKKVKPSPKAAVVVPEANQKGERQGKGGSNMRWLVIVGGVVALAVLIGLAAISGNNNGDNGNPGGQISREDAMRLSYTNDYMVVYNQSGTTQNITGLEFVSEDGEARFITRDFGQNSLQNFIPGKCTHIFIRGIKVGPPNFCAESDVGVQDVVYNQKSNPTNTLNWVWLNDGSAENFKVMLRRSETETVELAECSIEAGLCTFSLPDES